MSVFNDMALQLVDAMVGHLGTKGDKEKCVLRAPTCGKKKEEPCDEKKVCTNRCNKRLACHQIDTFIGGRSFTLSDLAVDPVTGEPIIPVWIPIADLKSADCKLIPNRLLALLRASQQTAREFLIQQAINCGVIAVDPTTGAILPGSLCDPKAPPVLPADCPADTCVPEFIPGSCDCFIQAFVLNPSIGLSLVSSRSANKTESQCARTYLAGFILTDPGCPCADPAIPGREVPRSWFYGFAIVEDPCNPCDPCEEDDDCCTIVGSDPFLDSDSEDEDLPLEGTSSRSRKGRKCAKKKECNQRIILLNTDCPFSTSPICTAPPATLSDCVATCPPSRLAINFRAFDCTTKRRGDLDLSITTRQRCNRARVAVRGVADFKFRHKRVCVEC